MKTTLPLLILLIISSYTFSQTFNQEIINEKGVANLTGKINIQKLNTPPYSTWFSKNYEAYIPNEAITNEFKTSLEAYTIKIFMGTWCGDSKREVPHFYKTLAVTDFPISRLTTVAVDADRDHYKQSAGGEHEGLNIHRVPTFIFYKDGKEVNRIVESPKKSIEEDIRDILSGNYSPNYVSVTTVDTIIKKNGTEYLAKNAEQLVDTLKNITNSLYELNTYANVLFFAGKEKEAIEILKFNTVLFPKEADTYISLANKLVITDNIPDAIAYYERSLQFHKNQKINVKIQELKKSLQ
ncbi:thioredoxin domain-containing protein [Aquimarina sp. 2201CG14-23]|uniref:thioredoxin domain-containing protein n=1 Tax=Aquimarina mycalae TaxID=3040073 RepID=UPI0024782BB9|nr:thioredoxin domain-containing protein [Aquimarina sp. 2201CG14-23]MDH7448438.1 thioredoxin domain-containing protein [Aquimarina sp. 2201CG14-23]